MNNQTTESRRNDIGFWISLVAITILAALQIGVIVYGAITGNTGQTKTYQAAPPH